MTKLHIQAGQAAFYCQGCKRVHSINIGAEGSPKWTYNGNEQSPTFSPSILAKYRHPQGYSNDNPAPPDWKGEYVNEVCHSFISDGRMQYLSDCTHELAGTTIDLPEFRWDDEDA